MKFVLQFNYHDPVISKVIDNELVIGDTAYCTLPESKWFDPASSEEVINKEDYSGVVTALEGKINERWYDADEDILYFMADCV